MIRYVEELANKIGPRGSTTRAERNAAKYLAEVLEPVADEVSMQSFRSVPTFSWAYGLYYFLMVVAAALIPVLPVIAALLALGNCLAYLFESHTFEAYTKLLPKDKSQNVIAKKSNPSEEGERRPRIILVAHYDSSRSGLNFHPKLVPGFRQSFIILNACMAAILVLALGAGSAGLFVLRLPAFYGYLALPFALYVLFSVLLLIHREIWGVHVPGGNDNAFQSFQLFFDIFGSDTFGMDHSQFYPALVYRSGMDQRFVYRFVGIGQFNIFSYQAYFDFRSGIF